MVHRRRPVDERIGGLAASRLPALAQTVRFSRDPERFLDAARRRYGSSFELDVWPVGKLRVVSAPGDLAALFVADPNVLCAGAATERVLPLLAGSVLCADGEEHTRRRRVLLPAFTKARLLEQAEPIERETARGLDALPRGRPVAVLPLFRRLAFGILARVVLGIEDERRVDEIRARVDRFVSGPAVLAAWPTPLRRALAHTLAARQARLDAGLRDEIARKAGGGADALALLIDAGEREQSLLAELRALLIVGHETTACALAWGVDMLARHPRLAERVADDDAYADAFAHETLRLRPTVVDAVRLSTSPIEIGRIAVPAGTMLMAAPLLVHTEPAVHPEPGCFRPERFLDARPAVGAYIPFGGGARRCLGAQLAMLELRVVLQTVARRARLSPGSAQRERGRLRGTALAPSRGATVVLRGA